MCGVKVTDRFPCSKLTERLGRDDITRRVAVYLETLQYRLEEGVSYQCIPQVTQLFTYLLMQHRTAATPTSVFLLVRHDSASRYSEVSEHQRLPKI